jgi:hypothetical protein
MVQRGTVCPKRGDSSVNVREYAGAVARTQRAAGIVRGRRSARAVEELVRSRLANRPGPALVPADPGSRYRAAVEARLVGRFSAEIDRRGGETHIQEKGRTVGLLVADRDRGKGLVLLAAAGWRYYSAAFGSRYAELAYLCGCDDAGDWAVRVPATCTTIQAALAWITPEGVRQAHARGHGVLRQGDVYLVQGPARAETSPAGLYGRAESHLWDPGTRTLTHPEHAPISAPAGWASVKVLQQRSLGTSRGAAGD